MVWDGTSSSESEATLETRLRCVVGVLLAAVAEGSSLSEPEATRRRRETDTAVDGEPRPEEAPCELRTAGGRLLITTC